ncbi:MAG: LysE family translocator [Rhizobiaceae bacterium]
MPPFELVLSFLIATFVFAFTPGPGMFYLAVQTMAHGANAGWLSSCAFHLASYGHIASAAFGMTVLMETSNSLLVAIKVAGAAYLIWMGDQLIRTAAPLQHIPRQRTGALAFRDSLIVELLNPKSALFHFAFLPQFTATAPAAPPLWLQIVLLGVIANVMFSLADLACIFAARLIALRAVASNIASRLARRVGGGILIALGVRIASDL